MTPAIIYCLAALSMLRPEYRTHERWDTCEEIVQEAQNQGVPPHVALAVGFVESRYNPAARSPAGALGPLQIIPKWHCPGRVAEGCDLVQRAIRLLHRYRYRWGDWPESFCRYSAGVRCTEKGREYAVKVLVRSETLRILLLTLSVAGVTTVWIDEGLRPPRAL